MDHLRIGTEPVMSTLPQPLTHTLKKERNCIMGYNKKPTSPPPSKPISRRIQVACKKLFAVLN